VLKTPDLLFLQIKKASAHKSPTRNTGYVLNDMPEFDLTYQQPKDGVKSGEKRVLLLV
jgi:hypothetical protein